MNLEIVVLMLAVGNIISIFGAYTAGRNSGYRHGYALGLKVADAWERTANEWKRAAKAGFQRQEAKQS